MDVSLQEVMEARTRPSLTRKENGPWAAPLVNTRTIVTVAEIDVVAAVALIVAACTIKDDVIMTVRVDSTQDKLMRPLRSFMKS